MGDVGGDKSSPSLAGIHATTNISIDTIAHAVPPATTAFTTGSTLTSGPAGGPNSAAIFLPSGTPQTTPEILWWVTTTLSGGGTAPDNMQPYVALLYCVKN